MNETIQTDERGGVPSASGAERLINCPASILRGAQEKTAQEKTGVVEPDSPAATFGTRVHAALSGEMKPEDLDTNELQTFEAVKNYWPVLMSEIGYTTARVFQVEERYWLNDPKTMAPIYSGRLDIVMALANQATRTMQAAIVEFKSLRGVAPAHLNWQLRAQAVLLAEETDMDSGYLCVLQPNANPPFTFVPYGPEDVAYWKTVLLQALAVAAQPGAPAMPGRWCDYCPACAGCTERNAYAALALAGELLPQLVTIDQKAWRAAALQTWSTMLLQDKVGKFMLLKMAADLFKDVKEAAEAELTAKPDTFAGLLTLTPGAQVRNIPDTLKAAETIARTTMPEKEFWKCTETSLGDLEIAYANHRQREMGKKETKGCPEALQNELATLLGELVEKKSNKPSLAVSKDLKIRVLPKPLK